MRKSALVVLVSILLLGLVAGCNVNAKEGEMATKEFNLTGFTKIDVGGAFQVEITKGDTFGVSITADDFPHLRIEKVNDTLIIKRQGIEWFAPFHTQPRATVTLPVLDELKISGASNCKLENFQSTNELTMIVSGASHVDVTNVAAGNLKLEVSGASGINGEIKAATDADFEVNGASRIDLKGNANNLKLKVTGASKSELGEYQVQNVSVEISGASNGTINLNGKLDANISGASNLYWSGTAVMGDIQTSGASNLRRK